MDGAEREREREKLMGKKEEEKESLLSSSLLLFRSDEG